MNEEAIFQSGGNNGKGVMSYEVVINMHVMRSNQQLQTITSQKGAGIPVMLSILSTIFSLDGLIRNGRQQEGYNQRVDHELNEIEVLFENIGSIDTDDIKFIRLWFRLMKTYNYQLQQMNSLGLTPPRDVTEVWGKIVYKDEYEKEQKNKEIILEEHHWVPQPGELDYDKEDNKRADPELSVSTPSEGESFP